MKVLACVNGWMDYPDCGTIKCQFVHGVKITNGVSIMGIYKYPFEVYIEKRKLVISKDGIETVYYIGEFSQTEEQLKSLIENCITGQLGNQLQMRTVEYTITTPEDTFPLPIAANEVFA